MKIGGVEIKGPAQEVLVLPRLDGDIVIRAQAVTDMSPFNAMCPEPKAPARLVAGGFEKNENDKSYREQVARHNELRFAYICVKSLEPSEIEWDKVSLDHPATWPDWSKELSDAGLSSIEVNHILVCILQANALDDNKLKEARETFLRGQGATVLKSSGPSIEQPNTPSGEPASDSE